MNRKTLNEWEFEKGIIVKTKKKTEKYTEKQFKKLISTTQIVVKTEKGLEYLQEI